MPVVPPDPASTLYLIDGHAQIFRAYYAIRGGMSSSVTGEPTHASFAFAGMLLKFFEVFKPRYAVMAIDTPGKTFRDELFADYKANREAPPDDFAVQIPRIFDMTRLFGIPILGQTGAYADEPQVPEQIECRAREHQPRAQGKHEQLPACRAC